MSDENNGTQQAPVELPVEHSEEPSVSLAIAPDAKAKAKQKRAERLAEAQANEVLGLKLLRIKVKKLGAIGGYVVDQLGVRKVGIGTIVAASDKAEEYLERCDVIVQDLMSRVPPVDPEVIVAMMELSRDFTRLLLDTGKEHVDADRQPVAQPKGNNLSFPFPVGGTLTVGIKSEASPVTQEDPPQLAPPPPPA